MSDDARWQLDKPRRTSHSNPGLLDGGLTFLARVCPPGGFLLLLQLVYACHTIASLCNTFSSSCRNRLAQAPRGSTYVARRLAIARHPYSWLQTNITVNPIHERVLATKEPRVTPMVDTRGSVTSGYAPESSRAANQGLAKMSIGVAGANMSPAR